LLKADVPEGELEMKGKSVSSNMHLDPREPPETECRFDMLQYTDD